MGNFAVIVNSIVENIIVAENKTIAEEVTGKTCVAYGEDIENCAHIGLSYKNGIFEQPPKPEIIKENTSTK